MIENKARKKIRRMLHLKNLLYILKIKKIELIYRYYNNLLTSYYGVKKTRKLIN